MITQGMAINDTPILRGMGELITAPTWMFEAPIAPENPEQVRLVDVKFNPFVFGDKK